MSACAECGSASPDGSTHCVHCGAALPAPGVEGPANTSHFGDQDVKNLVARVAREERAELPDGNLLAGLPRPKAASMVSPLRGGQTTASARQPAPEKRRARSAAGSTVMGMPLYTTGEQGAIRPTARKSAASADPIEEALGASGASIQSLDDFQGDIEADPAPVVEASPSEADAAGEPAPSTPEPPRPSEPSRPPEPSQPTAAQAPPDSSAPASPTPTADPGRTSTGPLDLSQPASSGKAGLVAVIVVLAIAAAAVAFFALK